MVEKSALDFKFPGYFSIILNMVSVLNNWFIKARLLVTHIWW
jgi:hypothetical protein